LWGGREAVTKRARQTLSIPPPTGTNGLFVAHGNRMRAVFGAYTDEAGAVVFDPRGGGEFELVAFLKPPARPRSIFPRKMQTGTCFNRRRAARFCEWKGTARYWALSSNPDAGVVGWSYPGPPPAFEPIRNYIAFYPAVLACNVSGERIRPQPGQFYGGWVTDDILGPFKGAPGTENW